jgi:type I restriction enzyme S subunit
MGEFGVAAGGAAIVPDFLTGANVNRALAVLKISRLLTSKFVLLVLLSPYFQNVFASSKLGSAQARINLGDLREFAFPLPPLAEQEQIVDIIDSHLSVLEKQEQALDALEVKLSQSRQSLLAAAFAGSLALGEF